MGHMKKQIFRLCFLITVVVGAQQKTIDSLELQLEHPTNGLSPVELLNELGWYYAFSDPEKGIEIAENAINMAESKRDSLQLGIAYERKGLNYEKLGQDSMLLVSYKQAEVIYKDIQHLRRQGALAFNLANFHLFRSNYERSLEEGYKALQVFETNADTIRMVRTYNQIGSNHIYLGNYTSALKVLQKGMLFLELGHNETSTYYAEILSSMGLLYDKLSQYETALEYQEQALQIYIDKNNAYSIANTYNNLGKLYGRLEQHDKALKMFNQSYDIKKKMGDKYRIANALTNIGLAYSSLGEPDNALEHLELTKAIYKELKHNSNLSIVFRNIGDVQMGKRQFSEAKKSFDSALAYAKKAKDMRAVYLSKEQLAMAYTNLSNYKKAYQLLNESQDLKDSLLSNENRNQLADLKAAYKYDKERALLEAEFQKKKALDEIKIKQQTFKKNVSIGVGIFSLILVVIGFTLYRLKKEADLNTKIVTSEFQKLKAQMTPHFIFNTLNSINDYVLKNDKQTASYYLVKFSYMMRRILEHSKKEEVTLQEEIDFLDAYIRLEQQRMSNAFDYAILVEDEVDTQDTLIPPALLQPFVENSIWHGFENIKTGGLLKLNFFIEDRMLVCEVDDNGSGMKSKRIKNINKKSFGASSVIDRIDLLNTLKGGNANVEFVEKEQGVKVVLKLPLILDD